MYNVRLEIERKDSWSHSLPIWSVMVVYFIHMNTRPKATAGWKWMNWLRKRKKNKRKTSSQKHCSFRTVDFRYTTATLNQLFVSRLHQFLDFELSVFSIHLQILYRHNDLLHTYIVHIFKSQIFLFTKFIFTITKINIIHCKKQNHKYQN